MKCLFEEYLYFFFPVESHFCVIFVIGEPIVVVLGLIWRDTSDYVLCVVSGARPLRRWRTAGRKSRQTRGVREVEDSFGGV